MSIKETHNPLSITTRVRERIEKQASGVQPASHVSQHSASFNIGRNPNPANISNEELSDQFLGLLLNPMPANAGTSSLAKPHSNPGFQEVVGTKSFFSPLKKQEESVSKPEESKAPFSLVIENSSLGPLQLRGSWQAGVLHVGLKLPKPPSLVEQKMLCAMLSKGLSSQLGVPLEISID